jgi:alpha-N-arabinofuranosidase
VVDNPADGRTAIFALNRHLSEPLDLVADLRGLGADRKLVAAQEIHHAKLKAANTRDLPDAVAPRANADVAIEGEKVSVRLKPASWNVIVTEASPRPA